MFKLIFAALLLSSVAQAKTYKIAVIDTGFDFNSSWKYASNGLVKPKLCAEGHYDFTDNDERPQDTHGHGTHVAGIIAKNLKDIDYCLVILKYFGSDKRSPGFGEDNLVRSNLALMRALQLKVDYINYSGGGLSPDHTEKILIKKLLDSGVKIFAAAGNERSLLSIKPYYPAMYDPRIYVAGAMDIEGRIIASSNRGKPVDKYLLGEDVISLLPGNRTGPMTGTSQATPLFLAESLKREHEYQRQRPDRFEECALIFRSLQGCSDLLIIKSF
ncbi:MAG: S8 family serine peptidase [Leptolyngbyaceae cyanobacterium RM2_2_4]|nr:S8 family serine peptidase [Leptolyngbyaceae cyanobacterium RM2_2_4]